MNFGGDEILCDYAGAGIIIVPVPYDETSTWLRGSDRGPDAILEASPNLEFYDIETGTEVCKRGIFTIPPLTEKRSPEAFVEAVYNTALNLLKEKKFPVFIGGNHTLSIGSARAFSEYFPDLSVLQLDAHADMRQEYKGSRFNHACTMARISEFASIVQVGIRSVSADELPYVSREKIYPAHRLHSDKKLYSDALNKLTDNVYLTIDIDVFDPSLIPATGTPEPGGPDYYEILHFIRDVAVKKNIVGFDVVELCPMERNKAPDFVAAKIIYQVLSYVFA